MENEINRVLIITTRHYPFVPGWDCFGEDDTLKSFMNYADFKGDVGKMDYFCDKPCIKTRTSGSYVLCVVPCLNNHNDRVTDELKAAYLEYVIGQVYTKGYDYGCIYLIAHDGDFSCIGENGVEGDFVRERHISGKCPALKILVSKAHAYMFQHGDSKSLGKIVKKIESEDFVDTVCDEIFDNSFGKKEMIDIFSGVNTNPSYFTRYPVL